MIAQAGLAAGIELATYFRNETLAADVQVTGPRVTIGSPAVRRISAASCGAQPDRQRLPAEAVRLDDLRERLKGRIGDAALAAIILDVARHGPDRALRAAMEDLTSGD